jgi:hypothetical protein
MIDFCFRHFRHYTTATHESPPRLLPLHPHSRPPRTDNGNYFWIEVFYSVFNDKGRTGFVIAGFVMANSAADARSSEQDLRQNLIESHAWT